MRFDGIGRIAASVTLSLFACATSHPANPEAGSGCPYAHGTLDVGACDPAGIAACEAWMQTLTPAGYTSTVMCSGGVCATPYICSIADPSCDPAEVCVNDTPQRHCLCGLAPP